MHFYAPITQDKRKLRALRAAGLRVLLTPGKYENPPNGFQYGIDNGAWQNSLNKIPFDTEGYEKLIEMHGGAADFIVIPDNAAAGNASLEFSKLWFDRLKHFRCILLPVQDAMTTDDVGAILRRFPNMGIFLGGSNQWKLKTLYGWGMVAHALGRHYHVGTVNTVRLITLCMKAGAHSIDGASATMLRIASTVDVHLSNDRARRHSMSTVDSIRCQVGAASHS
jgi:hypothetical protein